ncbi:putative ferrichrome-iron receptor FhuA [Acetobacteraceae bacterium AT-5844]|nr:putative ferrichrome-iron receptor FhuA [Acetobacteraceae bacterium AT-5844]
MNRPSSFRHLLLASAAATLCAFPALAQAPAPAAAEASEAGTIALPEVNVQATAWRAWESVPGYVAPVTTTGSKTDTPLIEAPQSVGVVTRSQIDDQAALSVSQALRYTAGVLGEVRPSARYDSVFVRGFGGQGTSAAFVNFLDGLRQGRGLYFGVPNTEPWLLERIEVLRGPASVLYGQTGVGGLVNLVSRRPSANHVNEVRIEAGSNALMQTAFDLGGALTEDGQFLYRLTGLARKANTQYDFAQEERIAIAPAFTWRPDDDTSLTVLASYQYDPEGGFYNFVPATGSVLYNPNGRLPRGFFGGDPSFDKYNRTQASIGYQFEHRLDNVWTVRQNFRYSHIDAEVNVVSIRSVGADQRTATRSATFVSDHANAYALDNQAQATFTTGPVNHTALFGIDWQRTSARARQGLGTAPSLDLFAPVYYQAIPTIWTNPSGLTNQNLDQLGFYAQDQIAIDRWRFNIGVRYDQASIGTTTHQASGAVAANTSQNDDQFTWRVGGLYLFDNGLAPYASYSTSFLPNTGTQAPQRGGGNFDPTTGEQYEIGIKYQPPGMNSFIQLAAYHIRQENVLTRDPDFITYNITQGEIRSRGIELEGRASLTDGLDLIGAYSYIDAEITKSNNPGVQGSRVPQVPNHMASAWANYRFLEGPLRGLSLGGGVRYIGPTYGNDTNTFKVNDYTLFDAAIRYDFGARFESMRGLELAVNAQNLADKDYVASCSTTTACYYGTGRMVLGSLRARW